MAKRKLTNKQELFCLEYIVDFNGAQAAVRAKYSKKTAKQIATENLTKPAIQDKIAKLIKRRSEKIEINADYVLVQAVEFLNVAMGRTETKVLVKENIGDGMTQTLMQEFKKHDMPAIGKALEIIGKHVDVKAFEKDKEANTDNSEITFVIKTSSTRD